MPFERPQWCSEANCPFYRNSNCELKNKISKGWPSREGRNRQFEHYDKLVKQDPAKIVTDCELI